MDAVPFDKELDGASLPRLLKGPARKAGFVVVNSEGHRLSFHRTRAAAERAAKYHGRTNNVEIKPC